MEMTLFHYKAEIVNVVDGDTVDAVIDLGLGVKIERRLRLAGIDTPEMFGVKKDSEEYKRGLKAKNFVISALGSVENRCWVKTIKDKTGKYGRYIAEIYFMDGKNLNELLVEKGLAKQVNY